MTISFDQARAIAEKTVRAIADAANDEFDIADNETIDEGWLFFYNSKDFIETGNPISALAGNGPIFVDRKGAVKVLPSAISWQVALKGRSKRSPDERSDIRGLHYRSRISLRSCGLLAGDAND